MNNQEKGWKKYFRRLKDDYVLRTFIFTTFSFIITLAFCIFNLSVGIFYGIVWDLSIGIYYLLLVIIRVVVGYYEIKWKKQKISSIEKEEKRKNVYLAQSILLFIIDLALIAPITLMMLQEKSVDYSPVIAITIAAYTVYKIVMASINFRKTRKSNHLSVKIFRNINFIDALVSILTLQYTLIMTFGTGIEDNLKTICAISSFAVWSALIIISITTLINAVNIKKQKEPSL